MANFHAERLIQTFTITANEPFIYEQKQRTVQGQGHTVYLNKDDSIQSKRIILVWLITEHQ